MVRSQCVNDHDDDEVRSNPISARRAQEKWEADHQQRSSQNLQTSTDPANKQH
jgi:hypothetical protein